MRNVENRKKSWVRNYLIFILAGCLIYYLICFLTRGEFIQAVFHHADYDIFMDYFHSINNAKYDPYADMNSNYPALACLVYKFLFHIVPTEYYGVDGFDLRTNQMAMVGFILYNVVSLCFAAFIIREKLELKSRVTSLAILAVFISAPFMFTLERGNLILIAFILTLFFCLFYESENKYVREAACLCLAIAAAIKIYPAIFGLLLIRKRKWKEAFRTVIYGILLFVVPFFYYDGFKSLKIMIDALLFTSNVSKGFGINVSLFNICETFSTIIGIGIPGIIMTIISTVVMGILVVAVFLQKKEWKAQLALALLLILLPKTNYFYVLIFLFIPFIGALNDWNKEPEGKSGKIQRLGYGIIFAGIFIPWATQKVPGLFEGVIHFVSYSMLIHYILLGLLGVWLTVDCIGNNTKQQRIANGIILAITMVCSILIFIRAL